MKWNFYSSLRQGVQQYMHDLRKNLERIMVNQDKLGKVELGFGKSCAIRKF